MKNIVLQTCLILSSIWGIQAQITLPRDGNKKAMVSENIGITAVTIDYSRPAVNGREGKIWGQLVPFGFNDLEYGTSKAAPWRAGANENTTIEFSADVFIEGKPLAKGKYGFFIAMAPDKATLIFSKFNTAWGSFYYKEGDDALRVDVPTQKLSKLVERLTYSFRDQTDNSAVVAMDWEFLRVPFTVSVDIHKTQMEAFRREVNSGIFYRYWQNLHTAANYCLVNNINLEEGLEWADRSINTYFGEENFKTLSTYAGLLAKLGRQDEADVAMEKAFPLGSSEDLVYYGIDLNLKGEHEKAFSIFKSNVKKNPDDVYAHLGMVSGHFYKGDKKKALQFCESAKSKTKNKDFVGYIDNLIRDINSGKEIFK
ncbi:DUF2911 domain-containing protein [Maribacter chungangensis]|uniref:DUF2911 domain-containing protein n=1 Tax=Maribacter chungangensis TaxID=1069117 RepID=A0ABW3B754_9FLAO